MSQKLFQRKKEDFVCANCAARVQGDGYTNHCPECLWSRHVDKYPGDRRERCRGMMRPVTVLLEGEDTVVMHCCKSCGEERRNKTHKSDNSKAIARVARGEF